MARRGRSRDGIGRDLLKGAIAGLVATFVMGKVTGYMYEHEDRDARREEDEARGDRSAYEVAADRVASAAGTAFGTGFWAFMDEGLVPALGLTPGATSFPWQTHARGLVGHLTFGTVTDGTLRLLDRIG
jgi:hypothetical protein